MSGPKAYETNPAELAQHIAQTTGVPLAEAQRAVMKMRATSQAPTPIEHIAAARTERVDAVRRDAFEIAARTGMPLAEAQQAAVRREAAKLPPAPPAPPTRPPWPVPPSPGDAERLRQAVETCQRAEREAQARIRARGGR